MRFIIMCLMLTGCTTTFTFVEDTGEAKTTIDEKADNSPDITAKLQVPVKAI